MKILGRDIRLTRTYQLVRRRPTASVVHAIQKVRQKVRFDQRFHNGSGFSYPPFILVFEICSRCNLRCKTCWFYGNAGSLNEVTDFGYEMNLDEIKSFIDNIARFKPYLLITGGEPSLHKHFIETIEYASKKGLIKGVISNGTFLNEANAEKIVKAGLDFLTISVDGTEETHNHIRGSNYSFKKTMEAIANIKKFRGKQGLPIITINMTMSDYNYQQLSDMANIADSVGVDILQFQHQWFTEKEVAKEHTAYTKAKFGVESHYADGFSNYVTSKINPEIFVKEINRVKNANHNTDIRFYPDLDDKDLKPYYEKSTNLVYNDACGNPWWSMIIKPNGDVMPCIEWTVGNVVKEKFTDIWNNEHMRKFRAQLNKDKFFAGCTRCCGFFQK